MHKLFRSIVTPLLNPEDGAMAGGNPSDTGADELDSSNVAAPEGDAEPGDDAGEGDGQGAQPDDDEESLLFGDGNDADDQERPLEERHKRLSQSHNKLKRKFGKAWPLVKRLRDANISERDIDQIVSKARNFDALSNSVGGDPKRLQKLLDQLGNGDEGDHDRGNGRDSGPDRRGKKTNDGDLYDGDEAQFSDLWNTSTGSGKFFVKQARVVRDQQRTIQSLTKRLDALEGGVSQAQTTAVQEKWSSALSAAASKIKDPDIRDVFSDAVKAAYHTARTTNRPIDPNVVIAHYLKKLKVNPADARIAANAAQQRMAQGNQNRPRQLPNTSVAPARGKKETVADVTRRLRAS